MVLAIAPQPSMRLGGFGMRFDSYQAVTAQGYRINLFLTVTIESLERRPSVASAEMNVPVGTPG
jgi:hypothetical protein